MDLKAYLTEQGYTAEEITTVLADAKMTKAMTSALAKYDEGKTALTQAQAEKQETANFWETETAKLQGSVTKMQQTEARAARAEAEAARRAAYLKSLKDQGYDVPDEMVAGAANSTTPPPQDPANGRYITRDDLDKAARSTAPDLVRIQRLSNEYYDLFGSPYIGIEDDYEAAAKAGKPLREYVHAKYNFEGKRQEKAQKADQERIDKIVAERVTAKEAELAAKYGSMDGLRAPVPSKFDKLATDPTFKDESWKSPEGRKANREARREKFKNLVM